MTERINRIGAPVKEDRPWTPYEDGQMRNHYPTKGPRGMAAQLRRTVQACKDRWCLLRRKAATEPNEIG